ncbi:hypothetical protein NUW58_g9446 [Xylaria curta]|uniref:Uncharacterized protein n=1 Tax=Xylaria curta TaxID=42375 RepID=A0ACC1MY77_9PEZI|nr:hypothetical protein NUW58_g9446 [Xylaria curta]
MDCHTKIWLATLNKGHSMIETVFSGLWAETLVADASHTSGNGDHYALFQCDEQPDLLAIIVGYHSPKTSLGERISEKTAARLLEFVTHKELYILDMNVQELPLDSGNIAMLVSESQPGDSGSLPGRGEWGKSVPFLVGPADGGDEGEGKRTWIHVASSEGADQLGQWGIIKNFSKILESHIDSQAAE